MQADNKKLKGMAVGQVFILILAAFSFAFILGGEVPLVSADVCDEGEWKCVGEEYHVCNDKEEYISQGKVVGECGYRETLDIPDSNSVPPISSIQSPSPSTATSPVLAPVTTALTQQQINEQNAKLSENIGLVIPSIIADTTQQEAITFLVNAAITKQRSLATENPAILTIIQELISEDAQASVSGKSLTQAEKTAVNNAIANEFKLMQTNPGVANLANQVAGSVTSHQDPNLPNQIKSTLANGVKGIVTTTAIQGIAKGLGVNDIQNNIANAVSGFISSNAPAGTQQALNQKVAGAITSNKVAAATAGKVAQGSITTELPTLAPKGTLKGVHVGPKDLKGKSFLGHLKNSLFSKGTFKSAKERTAAGIGGTTFTNGIAAGVYAAAGAYVATKVAEVVGIGQRNQQRINTIAKVVGVTGLAGLTTAGALGLALPGPGWLFAGAFAVTALVSAIVYKNFSQETVSYRLALWQPVERGEKCQDCNDLEYGCSEYQCRSFGAACEIVNPGTAKELCDWVNPNDMAPPIMDTLTDVLRVGYRYNPDQTITLPDRGVSLEYEGGCLPAFEGVEFGITTDEPAQCKIDINRSFNYEDMLGFMQEGSLFTYNHTFSIPNIALPSAYAMNEAGFTVDEGNQYEFYMRCKDVNDNLSPYNFVVNFCVDDGPDTTAPKITTNYIEGSFIRSDQVEIADLEVYTNEPAECRWDFTDRDYEDMSNDMRDCSTTTGEYTFPDAYSYGCRATLTGIESDELNTYYIRCQDKPLLNANDSETRIANEQSYVLNLQGTRGIVIDELILNTDTTVYTANDGPVENIVISDATEEIQVRIDALTSQGAGGEGEAICSYSQGGLRYEFYNNQNYDYTSLNNHYWYLTEENYTFDVQCCDLGNNCDTVNINFQVETDTNPPQVARSYHEDGLMKLVTDEEASCVYSLSTCNYLAEDGIEINTIDNLNHFVTWEEKESFYVKCRDVHNNYPDPNECSIIVRAQYEYEDINN